MEMRAESQDGTAEDGDVPPEVLYQGIEALEGKGKVWYAYLMTRDFWLVLVIGYVLHSIPSTFVVLGCIGVATNLNRQILALCITATNTFSTLLVNKGTSIPAFQTLFNYILLCVVFTTYTIYKYGVKKYCKLLLKDGWKYVILSFMDVEGNYFTVLAYRYVCLPLLCFHGTNWSIFVVLKKPR